MKRSPVRETLVIAVNLKICQRVTLDKRTQFFYILLKHKSLFVLWLIRGDSNQLA